MVERKDPAGNVGSLSVTTFATLVNSKIIVPSSTSSYFAVEKFFLFNLLGPLIDKIAVDDTFYLSKNPDVRDAISRNVVKDAREHYRTHGYFEGRMPYRIDVDPTWYENTYVDIKDAIRRKDFKSAQDHFEIQGFVEGRLPFPGFSLKLSD